MISIKNLRAHLLAKEAMIDNAQAPTFQTAMWLVQMGVNLKGLPILGSQSQGSSSGVLIIIKGVHLHISLSLARIEAWVNFNMDQDLEISHSTTMQLLEFLVLHHQDNNFTTIPPMPPCQICGIIWSSCRYLQI